MNGDWELAERWAHALRLIMRALGVVLIILFQLGTLARLRSCIAHHVLARMTARRLRGVLAINGNDGLRRCHK